MKKLILLLMLLPTTLSAFAQKITCIKEEDGRIVLCSSSMTLYKNQDGWVKYQLGCEVTPDGEHNYTLYLTMHQGMIQMDKGRKLICHFIDGTKLELTNIHEIGEHDYIYKEKKNSIVYSVFPHYAISEDAIKLLASKTVLSVQIGDNRRFITAKINGHKLSANLKQTYKKIQKRISQ